jgi:4-amino-4-deoxy-L-arabinose transferase-like glycosyltransferase
MSEKRIPWLWVLIAFLVASTRAFENGISLDPALFSAIARTFSREGVWWSQRASETLFPQYFEHPFLPIWLQGILFKLFGATDTTSRYLGLLTGPGSFYFLYRIGERLADRRFASLFCFVTLLSAHFTGRMATFYTEISLTFFLLGAFDFFLRSLDERPVWWSAWAGVFLGLAAWCKGLAVAPMAATFVGVALYRQRLGVFRSPSLWIALGVGTLFTGSFCGLQAAFGSYAYCPRYLEGALLRKVMGPGYLQSAPQFLKVFFETHPVHCLLALMALVEAARGRAPRIAVAVGVIASVAFLAAGSTLGKTYYHYFYPIYPMVNLLAAASLHALATRKEWACHWHRGALGFALAYAVIWHVLPNHMRRPMAADWAQLAGVVKALKEKGAERIQAVGIADIDWIYREMSLWYWDLDSVMGQDSLTVEGPLVIAPANEGMEKRLLARGYQVCASSPKYDLFVREAGLLETCRRAPFDPALIR